MESFICYGEVFFILCCCCFSCYVCSQLNCSSSSSSFSSSSSSPNTTHYLCPPKQSLALLQFKSTVAVDSYPNAFCDHDSPQKTTSWTESSDCCSWEGVTCDELTGDVIGLELDCCWLNGTIQDNSTLFHLSHLQWLNLAYNNFNPSQISPEFGRLTELTHLNLSTSEFYGLVPSQVSHLSKLTLLDLSSRYNSSYNISINQQNFDLLTLNLTRLSVLNLRYTNMSLVKPFSLLNLSRSLMVLDVGGTGIQGEFPKEIFRLPNLQELYSFYNEGLIGYLPNSNWSSHFRVLKLFANNFRGELPDSIGDLKFLEVLYIVHCDITGSIPASIGNLTRLVELDLAINNLTGELPSTLSELQKVTTISCDENMLTGQIPDIFVNFTLPTSGSPQLPYGYEISGLSHLTTLILSNNFLNGKVPSWLFTVPSLRFIDLSDNHLTGPIEQFNLANSLRCIDLRNNEIHGSIPNSFFELVNLNILYLSSNNLSGTVKVDMLSKMKNLESLDLADNSLLSLSSTSNMNYSLPNLRTLEFSFCNISEFPMFLRTSDKLRWLDLSNNRIYGGILKTKSEGWKSLTYLDLSHNFLSYIEQHPWKNIQTLKIQNNMIQGIISVPSSSIKIFLASHNKMSGQIPSSICNLRSLQILSLSDNNLSGIIPPCLGNYNTALTVLNLEKNNRRGGIPDTFTNLSLLTSLDLNSNKLEGPLPRSVANCPQLEVLNVGNNMIRDTFPCWLGSLSELKILVLRSNRFYGPLCDSNKYAFNNSQIIDLSGNEFTGFLPRRFFASLEKMMKTDESKVGIRYIGGVYYHESVNVTMKGGEYRLDRILTIFTSIDLSKNQFQGEIPQVLGNFKSLLVLNLSHNSLTGNIPLSFENLTTLESLDLSFNKLDGRIPDQLVSVTTLSVLNLSYNRLLGRIPQGNQFYTFENNSFNGNRDLCGKPLSAKCCNDGATTQTPPSSILNEEDETASGFDWNFAMMGYVSGVVIGVSVGYIVFSTGKPWWFVRMFKEAPIKKVIRSSQARARTRN